MSASAPKYVRYFVATGRGGGWLIFREGSRNAVHSLPQKLLAVETARTLAREDAPSQVMVEQRDGTFNLTYAFEPGGQQAQH